MKIRLFPPEEILETTVRLPRSKSVAARRMVINAMAGLPAAEANADEDGEDLRVLRAALAKRRGIVDVGASGTALRFLTAFFASCEGADVVIRGTERLMQRPIGPLVDSLRSLGADIAYEGGTEGCAPLHIVGRKLSGGSVKLDARLSSQFASALALAGPAMAAPLVIDLGGEIPSLPYLKMTLEMMRRRGVDADLAGYTVTVPNGPYDNAESADEADWSAASYWYEIAAVTAGWVTLANAADGSIQGDSILARWGERFGVLTEFTDEGAELSATPDLWSRLDMDMGSNPDLVPALAVTCCLVGIPFRFTGVSTLRHKESDRVAVLAGELRKLGCITHTEGDDVFGWEAERAPITEMPLIDPHDDHRIAMAFAAASVYIPGILIDHPEVVDKSYPNFWNDLTAAGFTIVDGDQPLPEPVAEP